MAFWEAVQWSTGMEFPEIIRFVLEETGYDNLLCLQNITEEDIAVIEKHINLECNWPDCINELETTTAYKRQPQFKLLPGHKGLLLKIGASLDREIFNKKMSVARKYGQKSAKKVEVLSESNKENEVPENGIATDTATDAATDIAMDTVPDTAPHTAPDTAPHTAPSAIVLVPENSDIIDQLKTVLCDKIKMFLKNKNVSTEVK